jgi:hypothetical protein
MATRRMPQRAAQRQIHGRLREGNLSIGPGWLLPPRRCCTCGATIDAARRRSAPLAPNCTRCGATWLARFATMRAGEEASPALRLLRGGKEQP